MKKILIIAFVLLFASTVHADFLENFDSYSSNQLLDGTSDDGGWKGWDNNPAWGANVVSTIYQSSPNAIEIKDNTDLIYEFSEATSGQWALGASMFIPSDFIGMTYFILLNTYADGYSISDHWSVQLGFDYSTNIGIIYDKQNHVYYDNVTPILNQWVNIRFDIDLDNNSVSAYYNDSFLYESSWHNSYGSATIAAIDLFANKASAVYYDNIYLTQNSVPEPSTMLLLGFGLIGLARIKRKIQ